MSKVFFTFFLTCMVVTARSNDVGTMLEQWNSDNRPKAIAVYMPWFGDPRHIDVGYSSQDPDVMRRQIDEAAGMGITGFAVDWNGPEHTYTDKNFAMMEQIASEKHFQVALLYNECDDPAQSTDATITALDKAYKSYFGPDAPYRSAYMTYNNRPIFFIFPKSGKTDWNLVRQHVNNWATPPLLVYKEDSPYANVLDGFYVWINPGKKGWQSNGSGWGKDHLEDFYKRMRDKYPEKIMVAGAWPGFDDSKASWGLNRHMDTRCGKTLEETLHMAEEENSSPNPKPFLMIQTWNDYEEGTALERRSLDCGKG
ncbi:MAG TPA: hypothetical protein VLK33_16815 [Terriglobales bacterium]|nr:hypothetical protein [Terriglobales bacterium]